METNAFQDLLLDQTEVANALGMHLPTYITMHLADTRITPASERLNIEAFRITAILLATVKEIAENQPAKEKYTTKDLSFEFDYEFLPGEPVQMVACLDHTTLIDPERASMFVFEKDELERMIDEIDTLIEPNN